jgi:hypothetical protein
MSYKAIAASVSCVAALLAMQPADAVVVGTVYLDDPDSNNASITPAATLPHADFTSSDINFNTSSSPSTSIADFLNNPTFTNLANGFDPGHATDNSFVILAGETFLNAGANSFVVGHDDGVVLTMGGGLGTVVNAPGPTSVVNSPFTVNAASAGLYSFTLQYTECCSGPANLVFQINGAPVGNVPEPASLTLLFAGLAGLSLVRLRQQE